MPDPQQQSPQQQSPQPATFSAAVLALIDPNPPKDLVRRSWAKYFDEPVEPRRAVASA